MSDTHLQEGMNWVAARFTEIGHAQGLTVNPLGWNPDTVHVGTHRHSFVMLLNGERQVVTFDDTDLEDLSDDPRLQIVVDGELRAILDA